MMKQMIEYIQKIIESKISWVDSEFATVFWDDYKKKYSVIYYDSTQDSTIELFYDSAAEAARTYYDLVHDMKITLTEEEIDEIFFN